MTTITNNKLTDEKIKIRINEIEDRRSASRDFWDGDYEYPEDIELLALRELQERRKADNQEPAPVVPEEMPKGLAGQIVSLLAHNIGDKLLAQKIWNACRAAMLQGKFRDLSQPVDPQIAEYEQIMLQAGWVMVPKKLTAENGAKSLLSGEFLETTFISCPECFADEECESCDGSGRIKIEVPVSWTTIKAIWNKGVEHFVAAPQQGTTNL